MNREQLIARFAAEMVAAQEQDETGEAMAQVVNRYLDEAEARGAERIPPGTQLELRMVASQFTQDAWNNKNVVTLRSINAELVMNLSPSEASDKYMILKDGSNFPGEKFWAKKSFRIRIEPVDS